MVQVQAERFLSGKSRMLTNKVPPQNVGGKNAKKSAQKQSIVQLVERLLYKQKVTSYRNNNV